MIRQTYVVYFNPRSHERSDQIHHRQHSWIGISIHAPTRGATGSGYVEGQRYLISIHAPTRGATSALCVLLYPPEFQSTLPREERRNWMKKRMLISNFNPRSHERSDKSERRINHGTINFNPRSHERSD